MMIEVLKSKIHCARVTEANLNYMGSICLLYTSGLPKYQGNNFGPNGHKYIREFDCEHIPATTYRVGGVTVSYTHLDVYKRQSG